MVNNLNKLVSMFKKLSNSLESLLYKKQSRYLLNIVSLNILDSSINAKVNAARVSQFNRLHIPIFVVTLLKLMYTTVQYQYTDKNMPIHLLSS